MGRSDVHHRRLRSQSANPIGAGQKAVKNIQPPLHRGPYGLLPDRDGALLKIRDLQPRGEEVEGARDRELEAQALTAAFGYSSGFSPRERSEMQLEVSSARGVAIEEGAGLRSTPALRGRRRDCAWLAGGTSALPLLGARRCVPWKQQRRSDLGDLPL
jgi:hypothetical protein